MGTQGVCVSTGSDFTCTIGDILLDHTVTIFIPFSVCEGAEQGEVFNQVSVYSPTDAECRFGNNTIELTAGTRAAPVAPVVIEKREVRSTPIARSTVLYSKEVKKEIHHDTPPMVVNTKLAPMKATVTAAHQGGSAFKLKVRNPNRKAIRLLQVTARVTHKNGRTSTLDLTEFGCAKLGARKIPSGWSEQCKVELMNVDSDVKSIQFIVSGVMKSPKGSHPVISSDKWKA